MKFCWHDWHVHKKSKNPGWLDEVCELPIPFVGPLVALFLIVMAITIATVVACIFVEVPKVELFLRKTMPWSTISRVGGAIWISYILFSIPIHLGWVPFGRKDKTCLKCGRFKLGYTAAEHKKRVRTHRLAMEASDRSKQIEEAEKEYMKNLEFFRRANA